VPAALRKAAALDPMKQRDALAMPYDMASGLMMGLALIVTVFYCLDALYGERRDRSILFWKSLPVSDRTTVLAKAGIPLVILPLLTFVTTLITQLLMLLWSTVVLLPSGLAATTWTRVPWLQNSLVLLYSLIAIALWHAPIYGWMLLVSAWARRAALLWAVLPLLAIGFLEKLAFNSRHFALMLRGRLIGFVNQAFAIKPHGTIDSLSQLTPGRFLSAPGLWIGLIFAAAFLAAAVRLRRYREPI